MKQEPQHNTKTGKQPEASIPERIPEEIQPLYQWFKQHGVNVLVLTGVVVLALVSGLMYLRHQRTRGIEASMALAGAESIESLENLLDEYGRTKVGPLLRLRLARMRYDAGQYDQALELYNEFLKRHERHAMADIARLGRAEALEGRQEYPEALAAYQEFVAAHPEHYLRPLAQMGVARCLAAQERKAEALDQVDRILIAEADTVWEPMARNLRGVIERFDGFRGEGIFDRLDAASKSLQSQSAPPPDLQEDATLQLLRQGMASGTNDDQAAGTPPAAE